MSHKAGRLQWWWIQHSWSRLRKLSSVLKRAEVPLILMLFVSTLNLYWRSLCGFASFAIRLNFHQHGIHAGSLKEIKSLARLEYTELFRYPISYETYHVILKARAIKAAQSMGGREWGEAGGEQRALALFRASPGCSKQNFLNCYLQQIHVHQSVTQYSKLH